MGGIRVSPFSIHVVRDSVVTLLPFTVKVLRLEIPLSPGPIFFASLSAKWHMAHFFSNTSLPRTAEPAAPGLAAYFNDAFLGCSCARTARSEEHTSELQSRLHLVCRLLLEKKKNNTNTPQSIKKQKQILHI